MTGSCSMKNRGRNRKSKKVPVFRSQRIKFATRKVMAITVSEQSLRRAITRPSPKRRLHCPNFPSMALRAELSASCFRNSGFTIFAGRPSCGPESLRRTRKMPMQPFPDSQPLAKEKILQYSSSIPNQKEI